MNPETMTPTPDDKAIAEEAAAMKAEEVTADDKDETTNGTTISEDVSSSDLHLPVDEEWDAETAELSKLRCASTQSEEIWRKAREKREREGRRNR